MRAEKEGKKMRRKAILTAFVLMTSLLAGYFLWALYAYIDFSYLFYQLFKEEEIIITTIYGLRQFGLFGLFVILSGVLIGLLSGLLVSFFTKPKQKLNI